MTDRNGFIALFIACPYTFPKQDNNTDQAQMGSLMALRVNGTLWHGWLYISITDQLSLNHLSTDTLPAIHCGYYYFFQALPSST